LRDPTYGSELRRKNTAENVTKDRFPCAVAQISQPKRSGPVKNS
jgi:hypothetical protein